MEPTRFTRACEHDRYYNSDLSEVSFNNIEPPGVGLDLGLFPPVVLVDYFKSRTESRTTVATQKYFLLFQELPVTVQYSF